MKKSVLWSIGIASVPSHDVPVHDEGLVNATGRDHHITGFTPVHCAECKSSSGLYWRGWRAYRTHNPELGESPAVAFYCPTCAQREFGRPAGG
jgi:hypothetical protein